MYSDVDLCVIASNDAYEALIRDRAAFVGRLGTPLFLEDFGFSDLVFFILDDGTEGELFLGSEERLEGSSRVRRSGRCSTRAGSSKASCSPRSGWIA